MEQVQIEIREHTQLAVLEQEEALFLERLSHPDAGANITRVAGRLPLHASSSGLVLLAHAEPAFRERILEAPLDSMGPGTITEWQLFENVHSTEQSDGRVVWVVKTNKCTMQLGDRTFEETMNFPVRNGAIKLDVAPYLEGL